MLLCVAHTVEDLALRKTREELGCWGDSVFYWWPQKDEIAQIKRCL